LILVPGMGHFTAHWIDEQAQPSGSRLACAYPKVLEYDGTCDPRDASIAAV
jgi:hypothetical protein